MHCSGHYKPVLLYKGDKYKKGFRQSGNDRDEYVAVNNGGFTISHAPVQQLKPGTTYVAQPPRAFNCLGISKKKNSYNDARAHTVIYRQNGTGRDSYIYQNNGGFAIQEGSYPFCGPGEQFKRSLRQYQPVQTHSSRSPSPQRYCSPQRLLQSQDKNRQRALLQQMVQQNLQSIPNANRTHYETEQDEAFKVTGSKKPFFNIMKFYIHQGSKTMQSQLRSNSQSMALQTKQRIKEYLQQRQALSNAQTMTKDIQAVQPSRNQADKQHKSTGKLGISRNQQSKLQGRNMNTIDVASFKREEDTLLLAAASTPALGNAFKQRKMTLERKERSTLMSNDFDKQQTHHASSPLGVSVDHERQARPQTTRLGGQRGTVNPFMSSGLEYNHSEFEEYAPVQDQNRRTQFMSPLQRRQQLFAQQQQSTCARLSKPHQRRMNGRFDTQTVGNFFSQTASNERGLSDQNFFKQRQHSVNSQRGQTHTSLLGTSARQKLLMLKLAKASKAEDQADEVCKNDSNFQQIKVKQANTTKNSVDQKRFEKQQTLAAVYNTGAKNEQKRQKSQMRATLRANLEKNNRNFSMQTTALNSTREQAQDAQQASDASP